MAVQGRSPEQMHLAPGAAFGAVDGAGPGVGEVGTSIGAVAGDEFGGEKGLIAIVEPDFDTCGANRQSGAGRAVARCWFRSGS
jgi:hypothetical protein